MKTGNGEKKFLRSKTILLFLRENSLMRKALFAAFFLFAIFILPGCAATKKQGGKSVQSAPDIPADISSQSIPATEENTQIPEYPPGLTEVFQGGASKVRDCVLKVFQEQGIGVFSSEGGKDIVITGVRSVTGEELKRIADLPSQPNVEWERGICNLRLAIAQGRDMTTNLSLSLRITGCFKTSLPLLRPSTWQRLSSNGVMEREILTAVSRCCQSENK